MRQIHLLFLAILLIGSTFYVNAQTGKIIGKVLNSRNKPLQGVTVKIINAAGGTTTNLEGRFILNLSVSRKYDLIFTATGGYVSQTQKDIIVESGKVQELTVVMELEDKKLATVTVSANKSGGRKETAASVISYQKNTNTVASVISAETIRRSPDKNTSDVLKRTPGASVQEGKFIVVRGLADRYNQAMLNGILLTSTEPDRKTFSFDLIPASMIDNIIINKAFVPEYPGEWAGGMIQVNTKDIPSKNFFNLQVGSGSNTQTFGKSFQFDDKGKLDWLGIDDGTRALPSSYTKKSDFDILSAAEKTAIGKQLRNAWSPSVATAPINSSFQLNGGFSTRIAGKSLGATIGIVYNKTNKILHLLNRSNTYNGSAFSMNYDFTDEKCIQETSLGALASVSLQLNASNKISFKSITNVNSNSAVTDRSGFDYNRDELIKGAEFAFKQNTFTTTQLIGEHTLSNALKLKWYGSFNILDGYIPDQRRIFYSKSKNSNLPYALAVSNTLSQQSGSRIYQNLNDYIYTAGGDLNYSFTMFGQKQAVKGGYMFQVKDRLFDAKLFANYLPLDNPTLRNLDAANVFDSTNFGNGTGTQFAFDAIKGNSFRYLANTILNSGFLQFDNQFTPSLRVVWGARVEHFDQLVGSVKAWDPRHTHKVVTDILPGLNATLKLNNKTNLRLSGSQTVIRPELRELSYLNIFDFELNASVQGNPLLARTKITNLDFRYELYPRTAEVLTVAVFYKNFENAIEQLFSEGSGGASTFNYQNANQAKTFGAELEFRKKLDVVSDKFKNFTLQANTAYIYSRIKDEQFNIDRPLQGQSPYLVNVGLLYDAEKAGFNATILYNQIGERIYLVGDINAGSGSPDIYEAPRGVLDFQMTKKIIGGKGELKLNISDILNQTQYFYQNSDNKVTYQKGQDALRFSRKFGTAFGLTFNYSF